MQWFQNRVEAVVVIEAWRRDYNAVRPHSSLGNLTPLEFATKVRSTTTGAAIF
jgi:putative transposase